MDLLRKGISDLVQEAVEQNQPDFDNILTKKEAKKLIKQYAQQEYFNGKEAANYLGVSQTTFWRWKNKYNIKVIVIDDIDRYKKSDLEDFMKEHGVRGYA